MVYRVSGLPSWLSFDSSRRRFSGTPTTYGTHTITVIASDRWNGTTNMTFEIVAGIRPNTNPKVNNRIPGTTAYRSRLFYYKLPDETFIDEDGDTLYYLLS